jgi:hypothetical protein
LAGEQVLGDVSVRHSQLAGPLHQFDIVLDIVVFHFEHIFIGFDDVFDCRLVKVVKDIDREHDNRNQNNEDIRGKQLRLKVYIAESKD